MGCSPCSAYSLTEWLEKFLNFGSVRRACGLLGQEYNNSRTKALMKKTDVINARYLDGDYAEKNPTWDAEDAPWKAKNVCKILNANAVSPKTVVEVGCGSGAVLAELSALDKSVKYSGYDIAPAAKEYWKKHDDLGIEFVLGDYLDVLNEKYEVTLLLDVLEHLADPYKLLEHIHDRTSYLVVHFPLDLSALSVLREAPLLHVRRKVGHIHYYTKNLALELLDECGYEVIDASYTNASSTAPKITIKTRLFGVLRTILGWAHKDLAVRLLGGETLMVLAKPKEF